MPNYASANANGGTPQAMASAYKTILALTAATATLKRAKVYDILVGTDGTPADNAMTWDLSRQTAAGTSTAITPNPTDGADVASGTVGSGNFTAEGTVTANSSVFNMGGNQRASFRWVAAPGGELVIPATNLAGFALRAKSPAYTGTVACTLHHQE